MPTALFKENVEGVGDAFLGSDNHQSIWLMVEYLARAGQPPKFFEMKDPINPNAYKRRAAYISAMEKLGLEPELLQVKGDGWNFEEIGFASGRQIIQDSKYRGSTILCSNDRLAIGLLSAAYESGLKVGHSAECDLRVAGHDDHPFSRYTCPSLTTIAQDYDAIGERSVSEMLKIIDGANGIAERSEELFEGRLVMRSSA